MNLERRDYGAPLRIWQRAEGYIIMPPRSARSAKLWFKPEWRTWQSLVVASNGARGMAAARPGPHLGKRIHWRDLPPAVQRFARESAIGEYCPKA